jgi:hypothetical protein
VNLPWDAACGDAIGAAWLRDAIAPGGPLGRAARERTFGPGEEAPARAALERAGRAASAIDPGLIAALRAVLAAAPDPTAALVRVRGGGVLGDVELFALSRFLDACAEVRGLASGTELDAGDAGDAGEVSALLEPGRTPSRTFYLADAFDAGLAAARAAAASARAAYDLACGRLAERVATYAGIEHVRAGEFVLMRDAIAPPLPPEIRVLRESSTFLLCELSLDEPALAAEAALDAANAAVAEHEERVRAELSAAIARHAPALEEAAAMLGALDRFAARVAFAQRYACAVPDIVEAGIAFSDARYLPLAVALEGRGRRYAPISLELNGIGIVTGPNMGGKTAALRTLGFLAACAVLGVPVPARAARIPLFDAIAWLGIGTPANDEGLLSAFGAEVVAVRSFLAAPVRRPLVLIDEFARTTSPLEGRALLAALLETLQGRGALALAATHLAGVLPEHGAAHFAIGGLRDLPPRTSAPLDLESALERIAGAMDYRVHPVAAGAVPVSDAIALADALGLAPELIARARAHL